MIDFIKAMIFNWNGSIDWLALVIFSITAILCILFIIVIITYLIQAIGFLLVKEAYKDGKITEKYYSPASSSTGLGIGMTAQGAAPVVTSSFEDETFTIEVKCDDDDIIRTEVTEAYYNRCKVGDRVTIGYKCSKWMHTFKVTDVYTDEDFEEIE